MNLITASNDLKHLSDQQLSTELLKPTGSMPSFLVLSELQRRRDMRNDYAARAKAPPNTSMAEEFTQQGLGGGMTQTPYAQAVGGANTSAAPGPQPDQGGGGQPPQGIMQAPQGNAVQGFAGGGPVDDKMATGDYYGALYPDQRKKLAQVNMGLLPPGLTGIMQGQSFGNVAKDIGLGAVAGPAYGVGHSLGLFSAGGRVRFDEGGGVSDNPMTASPYVDYRLIQAGLARRHMKAISDSVPTAKQADQWLSRPTFPSMPSSQRIDDAISPGGAARPSTTLEQGVPPPSGIVPAPGLPSTAPAANGVNGLDLPPNASDPEQQGLQAAMVGVGDRPSGNRPPTLRPPGGGGAGGAGGVSAGTGLDAYWNQVQSLRLPNRFGEIADENRKDRADLDRQKSKDAGLAVLAAGLGMMAGTSQFAATNIGAGGLVGVKEWNEAQKEQRAAARDIRNADTAIAAAQANRDDTMLRSAMQLQATAEWKHESAANRAASAGIAAMDRQTKLELANREFSSKDEDRKENRLLRQQSSYLGEAKEADAAFGRYATALKDGQLNGGMSQPEMDELKTRMKRAQDQRDSALGQLGDLRMPKISSIEEGRRRGLKEGDLFRAPDGSIKHWVDK